jgi:hypothetical protein
MDWKMLVGDVMAMATVLTALTALLAELRKWRRPAPVRAKISRPRKPDSDKEDSQ